jgi:hypothetical protein
MGATSDQHKHTNRLREDFLEEQATRGIHTNGTGKTRITRSGARVVIPVAGWRQQRSSPFLGATEGTFDRALLLCETPSGTVTPLCVNEDFLAKYGRSLSRSGNQIKFNVKRSGDAWALTIPGANPVPVPTSQDAVATLLS